MTGMQEPDHSCVRGAVWIFGERGVREGRQRFARKTAGLVPPTEEASPRRTQEPGPGSLAYAAMSVRHFVIIAPRCDRKALVRGKTIMNDGVFIWCPYRKPKTADSDCESADTRSR
jgi:hypothetical protein